MQSTYHREQGSPCYTENKRIESKVAETINEQYTSAAKMSKTRRKLSYLPLPEDRRSMQDTDATEAEIAFKSNDLAKIKAGQSKGYSEAKEGSQVDDSEGKLLHEYDQQIVLEKKRIPKKTRFTTEEVGAVSQHVTLSDDVGKKKKRLKSLTIVSDFGKQEGGADHDAKVENKPDSMRMKRKKKKRVVKEEADEQQGHKRNDNLMLGVYVHKTDCLKTELLISQPLVKVHVVDEITGQYVTREGKHKNVDHILPITTRPFDFRKNKSIIPEWQEQIVFHERFGYFFEQNGESPRVTLFFEILDLINTKAGTAASEQQKHRQRFRKIAWAFLKPVGANGVLNIGSKLRLQLFCPPPWARRQPKTIEVVEWWKKYPRHKYASTLYVTVKGLALPEPVNPRIHSTMALQEDTQPLDNKPPVMRWSRLPGQVCQIPNHPVLEFRGGQMGCFTVLFSHAGTMLAAACADRDTFPVVVYEIPSGRVLAAFSGHLKIVYNLCWSRDGRRLLSASSDGTVREWDVERLLGRARKVLPHPSFVYSSQYHPTAQNLVVTGGYDRLMRVWRVDVGDVNGQLLQEFEGHSSFINTICFDSGGRKMFSADNTGLIIGWKTSVNHSRPPPCHHWCMKRKFNVPDLSGVPINMLQLHPNGQRLLIHTKDSVLRILDLKSLVVKKYTGGTNYKERIYSTLTPCGSFIFSGSEVGVAYVWNADTGNQVAVYSDLRYLTALHGVSFHPHENMVAFCGFGKNQPVHVYLYDRNASRLEVRNKETASKSALTKIIRNTPDPPVLNEKSASPAIDTQAKGGCTLRNYSVKEVLDSVIRPHRRSLASGHMYEQENIVNIHTGTRLTSHAGTMRLKASLPPPSYPSPQSKLQRFGSLVKQFIPQALLSTKSHKLTDSRWSGAP